MNAISAPPAFSIVINNYNYGRYLKEAVESCLAQSYPAHEIIVVDDGSTDGSREILGHYQSHPRIKIIFQENQGQEAALQHGFDAATGDWIMGLDADDFYFPDCLQTLAENLHEDFSLLYFRARTIDEAGRNSGAFIPSGTLHCKGNAIESWIIKGRHHSFPPQSFNCYSAKLIRSLRIYPHEFLSMKKGFSSDRYLQLQAVLAGNVQPVDRILGAYRVQAAGDNTRKRTDLFLLRQSLLRQDQVMSHVQKQLQDLGLTPHPLFQIDHYYWFYRMLSLVTDASGHTHPGDTRLGLIKMNLLSEWGDCHRHSLVEKSINCLKLFLMFTLPQGLFFRLYLFRPKYRITRLIKSLKGLHPA